MTEVMQNLVAWIMAKFNWWTVVGFGGQAMFMMRFIFQWIASEKEKKSVVPEIFWVFSLGGGFILFIYAMHQGDPVFILGQGLGLFIYLRNMYFIWRHKKNAAQG